MGRNIEAHDFYCINCGKKGMVLSRQRGHRHASFHRKKLWCFHCKKDVNMVECKNEYEVQKFLKDFKKGVYENEAKESLCFCNNDKKWETIFYS